MKTDTLFYELFQTAPQTFFELLQITPLCPYRFESITVKTAEKRIDGVLEPTVEGNPIYFVEVQGFPDDLKLHSIHAQGITDRYVSVCPMQSMTMPHSIKSKTTLNLEIS